MTGGACAGLSPKACEERASKACVDMLIAYRRHCASSSRAGQLILPEPLQLLPLFTLALSKCPAFRCAARRGRVTAEPGRAPGRRALSSMPLRLGTSPLSQPKQLQLLSLATQALLEAHAGRACPSPRQGQGSSRQRADRCCHMTMRRAGEGHGPAPCWC